MKREFLIDRQGKQFALYAGLLDLAHEKGLKAIGTQMLQAPTKENGEMSIFKAVAEFEDGRVFEGHGDATPQNVGRNIVPHALRMAETRAKARALRDALNIGAASLEELGDDDAPPVARPPAPARTVPRLEPWAAVDQAEKGPPAEQTGELTGPRWGDSELGRRVSMAVDMLSSLPADDPARRFVLPVNSATDAEVEQWLASKRRLVAARKTAQ